MNRRFIISFAGLFALLVILALLNLSMGSVRVEPGTILGIITGSEADPVSTGIIKEIRIPRLIGALILGGALSVSGFLLQTFFHNPLAGPFVLGISSGAKLAVALAMTFSLSAGFLLNSWVMIGAAFLGAMTVMLFILAVSGVAKSSAVLIICGIMAGYFCSALTELAVTFADDQNIVNLHSWSQGSFSGISRANTGVIVPAVLICMVFVFIISKPMGAYQLGEAYARSSGVSITGLKIALIILSGLLSAVVAAFAGPVSFVGIAVPQLMKGIFKTEKPVFMIPASFLGGAVFCLFCDLLARLVFAPVELSISVVTSIFGAPVVIWVMLGRKRAKEGMDNGR
ncbi:MAG: iron ABC transporter permease [Lachnospiraceae bacterium]|nr:iron ABC transporter permease [Lachnospiraceae bacterium]